MRSHPRRMVILLVALAAGSAPGRPGEGIQAGGDVLVRPFADAAISYDSNPLLLRKGQELDDFFLDASSGLQVTRPGDVLRLDGLFWGRLRRFEDLTSEDSDDLSEELRLGLGRQEDWRLRLHERFGRVSDYDLSVRTLGATGEGGGDRYLDRSDRIDRHILDCGVGVDGPLTDKTSVEAMCGYGKINYLSRDLLDSTEATASVKAARKVTDKSMAILVVEYSRMENDSLSNPANYCAARAGWRWQGTFKSRFEGTAGCSRFALDDSSADGSLDRDGFSYDVAWYWQAWPKLSLTLGGRSEMHLAADTAQGAKVADLITTSAQYSPTQRLALGLLVGYCHEDFTDGEEVVGEARVERVVEQLRGRLRCDYHLLTWLKPYGEVWQEDTQDNVRGGYQETRITLGVKAEY